MASKKPRLCAIYLRDLLTLTTRPLIDKSLRRVSRHFNSIISTTGEGRLPKRQFKMVVQVGP